jgi:hypothetical protein
MRHLLVEVVDDHGRTIPSFRRMSSPIFKTHGSKLLLCILGFCAGMCKVGWQVDQVLVIRSKLKDDFPASLHGVLSLDLHNDYSFARRSFCLCAPRRELQPAFESTECCGLDSLDTQQTRYVCTGREIVRLSCRLVCRLSKTLLQLLKLPKQFLRSGS